jgi:hypothetical protein
MKATGHPAFILYAAGRPVWMVLEAALSLGCNDDPNEYSIGYLPNESKLYETSAINPEIRCMPSGRDLFMDPA